MSSTDSDFESMLASRPSIFDPAIHASGPGFLLSSIPLVAFADKMRITGNTAPGLSSPLAEPYELLAEPHELGDLSKEWDSVQVTAFWHDVIHADFPASLIPPYSLIWGGFLSQGMHVEISQDSNRDWESQPVITFTVSPSSDHLPGPIQFINNLLQTWRLQSTDAVPLLGFEQSSRLYVENLLHGRSPLVGHDVKARIAYLIDIRMTLSGWFQDEDVENEWLREPHSLLGDRVPINLLLEGSMENLLLVKEYVAVATGR